jgi:hypothetical protein
LHCKLFRNAALGPLSPEAGAINRSQTICVLCQAR